MSTLVVCLKKVSAQPLWHQVPLFIVRWLTKVLYTLKITLFSSQLLSRNVLSRDQIGKITFLALFLALCHVPAWLKSTVAVDVPKNDLELKQLSAAEGIKLKSLLTLFHEMVLSYEAKLENHLWYLYESDKVLLAEKMANIRELKRFSPIAHSQNYVST